MGKKLIVPGADFSENAITKEIDYTLQNGYATIVNTSLVEIDESAAANAIRVRTSEIAGSYTVKTKTGYTIRAIVKYGTSINIGAGGKYATTNASNVSNVQGLTQYTLSNDNGYSIVIFCKTNASEAISASEDIVDYIM